MMVLCLNCLKKHSCPPTPVGEVKGNQRDPYQETISLCEECRDLLIAGDLVMFHGRFTNERTVRRD